MRGIAPRWVGGVGIALALCGGGAPLAAQDDAWVLIQVKRSAIRTRTEHGYWLHAKDTATSDGSLNVTFLADWVENPRSINRSVGWMRPPGRFKPGDTYGCSDTGDTTQAKLWCNLGLARTEEGWLSNAQGGPGGTTLTLPAAHDPSHPYLFVIVDATLLQSASHEAGVRKGVEIPRDSEEIARGDPVEYRNSYTGAGTVKASAGVQYTYIYRWGATEMARRDTTGTIGIPQDWKTIVGGGALAAAAAALAAAYWRKRRASGDKSTKPPDGPVGYVLQLSHDRLTLQAGERVALTVTVWAVDHTGATSLASSASISLSPPRGIVAAPTTGRGRLVTQLTAMPEVIEGTHALEVSAEAGGSTYSARVAIAAGAAYTYTLEVTPPTLNLQRDGRETVGAFVRVKGPDPAQCQRESQRLAGAISFTLAGSAASWFGVSERAEGGGKSAHLELTIPDNAATLPGPHLATCTAQLDAPTGRLTQACAMTVTLSESFELAMDQRLPLQANDVAGSLAAMLRALDREIPDAAKLIAEATPVIRFAVDGPQAHWLREEGGKPGQLRGDVSGGATPAKEVHPIAEVPLADLAESPPFSATITASVDVPRYGAFSRTAAVEIAPPRWFVELQPIKDKLKIGMTDAALFRARVLPADEQKLPLYLAGKQNVLNQHLTFYADGKAQPYTFIGERETDGECREYEVQLRDVPKDADLGEHLDLVAEATLCGMTASQRFRINLSPKPRLTASPQSLALVSDGEPADVKLRVEHAEDLRFAVRVEVEGTSEVEPYGPPESDDGRNFLLRVQAGAGPEGQIALRNGTLRVTASARHPETSEEIVTDPVEVALTVGQVGLSISPNPVRLSANPQAAPSTFKVRVVRFNAASKTFESVPSAAKALELGDWEDGETEKAGNVFTGAGVTLQYVRTEGSGPHAVAIWSARAKLVIPAPTPMEAARDLTAPGDWGEAQDRFSARARFVAPVDPEAERAMRIGIEQARCRRMLQFLPAGPNRDRFAEIIERDAKNLGVEGLQWQRSQIWAAARACLEDEAASYLQSARMQEALVSACDWAHYVGGLAMQGLSSAFCPFPSDLFVNLLYGAMPDFAQAVADGRVREWPREWVMGMWAGADGLVIDTIIGGAINLEDLIKQGLKDFKDIRKAFVGACAVFWFARFTRWYHSEHPGGEPFSFKDAVLAAVRDLAEEVVVTGVGKNATFRKQGMLEPGATGWIGDYDPARGHGYSAKDGRVYHPTKEPPDTRGMPDANVEAARRIAKENGVEIYIRPTNPASKKLLDAGALPKPEKIKSKTINELDLKLGRKPEDLGKVGYFDPGADPPPQGSLSKKEYEDLVDRYKQRKQEFVDNQKDFDKLSHDHVDVKPDGTKVIEKVTVDANGVVTNHTTTITPDGRTATTSKPYTGDHDVYDLRGAGGRPLTSKEYDKVMQKLRDSKFAAQHPGHRQWDYSKLDKYPPPPKPDAFGKHQTQQSKFKKAQGIDQKIRDSHQSTTNAGKPGEALIKVDAKGQVSGAFHNSPTAMKTHSGSQRAGQAAASADRDRRGAQPGTR